MITVKFRWVLRVRVMMNWGLGIRHRVERCFFIQRLQTFFVTFLRFLNIFNAFYIYDIRVAVFCVIWVEAALWGSNQSLHGMTSSKELSLSLFELHESICQSIDWTDWLTYQWANRVPCIDYCSQGRRPWQKVGGTTRWIKFWETTMLFSFLLFFLIPHFLSHLL